MTTAQIVGNMVAGGDIINTNNFGGQQETLDELKADYNHKGKLIRKARCERIARSIKQFIPLIIGFIGNVIAASFALEIILSYTDGLTNINIKIIFTCLSDIGEASKSIYFMLSILGFVLFEIITIYFPIKSILNLWFKDDAFMAKQRKERDELGMEIKGYREK